MIGSRSVEDETSESVARSSSSFTVVSDSSLSPEVSASFWSGSTSKHSIDMRLQCSKKNLPEEERPTGSAESADAESWGICWNLLKCGATLVIGR